MSVVNIVGTAERKTIILNGPSNPITSTYICMDGKDLLHSFDDKPSQYGNGIKVWHFHGKLHRVGKPALIENDIGRFFTNGEEDFINPQNEMLCADTIPAGYIVNLDSGYIHSDNGPAMIYPNGTIAYYCRGNIHRDEDEGPAIITASGTQKYVKHGVLHREDGPAIITGDGRKYYIIDGVHAQQTKYRTQFNIDKHTLVAVISLNEWSKLSTEIVLWNGTIKLATLVNDQSCKDILLMSEEGTFITKIDGKFRLSTPRFTVMMTPV